MQLHRFRDSNKPGAQTSIGHSLRCFTALLFFLFNAVALADTDPGDQFDFGSRPSLCHSLRYSADSFAGVTLEEWVQKKYQSISRTMKRDIVCMGDEVTISTPIFSNGGDVFILANSVTISAVIDTRVYRSSSIADSFIDPTSGGPFPGGNSIDYYANTFSVLSSSSLLPTRAYLNAFKSYYACDPCRTVGSSTVTARMPDGLTPPMKENAVAPRLDGIPAPDTNRSAFKSGSIFIFGKRIKFNGENEQTKLLIATGLPGGRGGAGNPPGCIGSRWDNQGSITFTCAPPGYSNSGLNAPGSTGGDAGNIGLFLQNDNQADQTLLRTALEKVAHLEGGPPGFSRKLRSPSDLSPWPLHESIDDFRAAGDWPQPPAGNAGERYLKIVGPAQLFSSFYSAVTKKYALVTYDLADLGRRVASDRSKDAVFFDDYMVSRLWDINSARVVKIVDSLMDQAFGPAKPQPEALGTIYRNYHLPLVAVTGTPDPDSNALGLCALSDERTNYATFSSAIATIITRLTPTCSSKSNDKIADWPLHLAKLGGAFALPSTDTARQLDALRLQLTISENEQTFERILAELFNIDIKLLDIFVSLERTRMEGEIRGLQSSISALRSQLATLRDKNENNSTFKKFVDTVAKLYLAYETFGASLAVAPPDTDSPDGSGGSSNSPKRDSFIKSSQGAFDATVDFQALVDSEPDISLKIQGTQNQIAQLARQVAAVQRTLTEFLAYSAERKRALASDLASQLLEVVSARSRYAYRSRERLTLAGDLIRASLVGYVDDPARQIDTLIGNLEAVKTLLLRYPRQEASFKLSELRPGCVGQGERSVSGQTTFIKSDRHCITVKRGSKQKTVRSKITLGGKSFDLELFLVAPGSGSVDLNLFGLEAGEVSVN